jgi:hypothetical protein
MAKRFEYKGPEIIKTCSDCLYCQTGTDEEVHCFHPDEKKPENLSWMSASTEIPDWCPLPEESP